jgi:hypothetical protein
MEIITEIVTVVTTGSAGSATGSAQTPTMHGYLIDIYLDFNASAPATTDVTISYVTTPPGGNVLVVSNSATDALIAPRIKPVDNANAAITNAYDYFFVSGKLNINLAQCDQLTPALTAYVRFMRV